MFASRHNHAFRGHQPDKENMITQTPLRPGMAFKTPMTQRTLHPSTSKMMMNDGGMHTVGPKRVQMSEKDGCRTELRPRVGPSLNRNGANLAGGASPFAGKGKGKGVELGKPQQLGNHEPTSGFDVNLGPKRLFTNSSRTTPLKQTAHPLSFQTNTSLPPLHSTPLPSATRSRRRSRIPSNSPHSNRTGSVTQTPAKNNNTHHTDFLQTPGPALQRQVQQLQLHETDKFKTPCRPSSSYNLDGSGYPSFYSPGDEDLLEDDDENEDEDGNGQGRSGGLSFRGMNIQSGLDNGVEAGMEMMQLNAQEEEQEDEDEIEYMPPRAQELPHEPPFSYTPLSTIGRGLVENIRGDYLIGAEDDFDGYVNGHKWDVLDLDLGGMDGLNIADEEKNGLTGNGMRMIDSEEPFLRGIVAGKKRQEEKRRLAQSPLQSDSTAGNVKASIEETRTKPSTAAKSSGSVKPMAGVQNKPVGRAAVPVKQTLPIQTLKRMPTAGSAVSSIKRPVVGSRTGATTTSTSTASRPPTGITRQISTMNTQTTKTTGNTTTRLAGRVPLRTLSKPNVPVTSNRNSTSLARSKSAAMPAPTVMKEVFEVMDLELEMPDQGGLTELAL